MFIKDNRSYAVKTILLIISMLSGTYVFSQNITDMSVKGNDGNANLDLSDRNSINDSLFAHPERIKYDNRCFQIDGRDTYICSGTFHYFRVAKPLWDDRFKKLKAAGFNCVETYVPWNWHERAMPRDADDYSVVNLDDLRDFLKLADHYGLYVILRPEPYICAEWSGGGFPQWLMQKKPSKAIYDTWLQSDDSEFVKWSAHWYNAVCRVVAPFQITRKPSGGKGVILFQIENEYERVRWFPHDAKRHYLEQLASIVRNDGIDVPVITCWTSESRNVKSGPLNGVIDMVNSYPRWQIKQRFGGLINTQLLSQPGKPLVSGELQGGWCCELGWQNFWEQDGLAPVQTQNITLYALQRGFSAINYYMVVGGTNFDDWAARQQITSYDYAAAIGEDGSINERYLRMKNLTAIMREYGTRIARASLSKVDYTSTDPQVEMALRKSVGGDRYYFIRTEEHTRRHSGTLHTDSLAIDFNLEPFGSMIYFIPAGMQKGKWLPEAVDNSTIKPVKSAIEGITKIGEWSDRLPEKWYNLKKGETIDDKEIYGRHFVYYKTMVREGCMLHIGRIGKGVVNGSAADTILVSVKGRLVNIACENGDEACYRIPGDSLGGKEVEAVMLFENRGLHHHTNASVEQHWKTGPRYVRCGGKDLPLRYAYNEYATGLKSSVNNDVVQGGNNPLLKWWKYSFHIDGRSAGTCHLRMEQYGNGFIYVNGHCIGRCWEQGPQREYYIPECWLNKDKPNIVVVSLRRTDKGLCINDIKVVRAY